MFNDLVESIKRFVTEVEGNTFYEHDLFWCTYKIEPWNDESALVVHKFAGKGQSSSISDMRVMVTELSNLAIQLGCQSVIAPVGLHGRTKEQLKLLLYFGFIPVLFHNNVAILKYSVTDREVTGG